ncbi:MAG: PrgI family protein [Eubacteriaceae bacterium]|nr:PrgI family protein [Eubacteriaceae bacterium]
MLEVKIPKEITEYSERFLMGMSIRQFLSLIASAALSIFLYVGLVSYTKASPDTASTAVIVASLPVLAVGFIKINGKHLEKYALIVAQYYLSEKIMLYSPESSELIFEEAKRDKAAKARKLPKEDDLGGYPKFSAKKARKQCRRAVQPQKQKEKARRRPISTANNKV